MDAQELATGDNDFVAQPSFSTGLGGRDGCLVDVDHDGVLDFLSLNENENTVTVLYGNTDGSFSLLQTIPFSTAPSNMFLFDVDMDGLLDLFMYSDLKNNVSWCLGTVDRTVGAQASSINTGSNVIQIVVEDVDSDGATDFIGITGAGCTNNAVYTNTTSGAFFLLSAPSLPDSCGASSGLLADINGDGFLDLITCKTRDGTQVSLGHGHRLFSPR